MSKNFQEKEMSLTDLYNSVPILVKTGNTGEKFVKSFENSDYALGLQEISIDEACLPLPKPAAYVFDSSGH